MSYCDTCFGCFTLTMPQNIWVKICWYMLINCSFIDEYEKCNTYKRSITFYNFTNCFCFGSWTEDILRSL